MTFRPYDLIDDIEMNIWLLCRGHWKRRLNGPGSAVRKEYEDRKVRVVVEASMKRTVYLVWIRRDVEGQPQALTLVFRVMHGQYLVKGRRVSTFRPGRWVEYLNEARSQQRLPDYEPDLTDGTDLLVDLEET